VLRALVYFLCLAASAGCAALLVRSYARNRARLLLWSAACFVLLALNNLLVVVDLLVLPAIDLLPVRRLASVLAVAVLLFGFIWESD
jgi:Family of unknown function (DUF5985)